MSTVPTAGTGQESAPPAGASPPGAAPLGETHGTAASPRPGGRWLTRWSARVDGLTVLHRAFAAALLATLAVPAVSVPAGHRAVAVTASAFLPILAGLAVLAHRVAVRQAGARRDAEQEAAASHNQLQDLIDNTSAVIYMKRIDNGQYVLVNGEWERLFGVDRGRVISLTDQEVFPPALAEQLRANDLGVAKAGGTVQYEETAEVDAEIRTYISVKFPVKDSAGQPYAVCGISTDITERKQAEEEVRQLNAHLETRVRERTAELEASTRELDAFAYSVSHDLRAPLRSLHGFSDALLEDYIDVLDEEGRDYLRRIQHNVQRMGRMIDDLLNLSRATRAEIVRETVDLSGIAGEVLAELAAADPGRTVTTRIADDLRAYGDPQLIRMALHNLLANAWKFSSKRADPVIEVGRVTHGTEELYFVRDNGAGFDMQYAGKLFNAFQRLHPVAEFEGTGIGLAIVARVIRRHGGTISAHAEIGNGATFTFNLTSTARDDTPHPAPAALEGTIA
ncbi:ATP-binding protein [Dactylosporangium sp. NPDC049525]|uniref:sensor histidine kinase n=1 Tax=Dactylosporangium sp. NPDC049525 TaxID=3154730 RepID=UPI003415E993